MFFILVNFGWCTTFNAVYRGQLRFFLASTLYYAILFSVQYKHKGNSNNDKVTDAMDNQPPQPPPPTTAADEGGSLAVDNTASIKKNDNELMKNEEVVLCDNSNDMNNINIKSVPVQPHQLLDQGSVSATAAAASTADAMSRSDSKLGSLKDDDDITSVSLYL